MTRAASLEGVVFSVSALEGVPLFEGLGSADLVTVAASMRFREFPANAVLAREGRSSQSMLVLLDGYANELASMAEPAGVVSRSVFVEGRLVGKLRRGDVVGAMQLITGEPRATTVKTAVPTTALELGQDEFRDLIARFPAVLGNLGRILSERLAAARRRQASGGRGEALALLAAPSLADAVPAILAAAREASPGPLESIDAAPSLEDAFARLDDALLENRTVVVAAGLERDIVQPLLEQVDRAVVLLGEGDRASLPAPDEARAPMELVLAVEGGAGRKPHEEGVVRLVERRAGDGPLAPADVGWLGRHLSRTKLGLALGAGGAKGYAHVGALKVLEEAGYTVDYVGGSSIGAIVGAYLALGMDADQIETTLRKAFTPEAVGEVFKLSLSGQSTGLDTMKVILSETTGERTFDDTVIPLIAMAADLTDLVPAPQREGLIWEALLASTALAGMFPPYERDGHRYVDGLALVPVPSAAVAEDGADVTVAVNLMSHDTLPAWPGQAEPPADEPKPGSRMLETLLAVMDMSQLDTSVRNAEEADVAVTPKFGPSTWRDFELADLFLAAGRRAASERLPELKSLARPQKTLVTR